MTPQPTYRANPTSQLNKQGHPSKHLPQSIPNQNPKPPQSHPPTHPNPSIPSKHQPLSAHAPPCAYLTPSPELTQQRDVPHAPGPPTHEWEHQRIERGPSPALRLLDMKLLRRILARELPRALRVSSPDMRPRRRERGRSRVRSPF